jgi:hypothetical protein
MALDNPLDDSESHAGAVKGSLLIELLKDDKDTVKIFPCDADSVILHRENPFVIISLGDKWTFADWKVEFLAFRLNSERPARLSEIGLPVGIHHT